MLNIYTGRNRLLSKALIEAVRGAQAPTQLVVVPKQLTLQTEQMLLKALNLRGSFRIQVLSAERLCARIFEAVGQPDGVRVDDRGRVMLVRSAIKACGPNLTLYRGAEHRRGFSERAAEQLEKIRQAQVTAETLRACADQMYGSAAMKLNDLAYILEAYESLLEGQYQDGETEFRAAERGARGAAFLKECGLWFFGFDMVPPTLYDLVTAAAAVSAEAGIFMPLENDETARDFDAFLPLKHSLSRLVASAKKNQAPLRRIDVEEEGTPSPSGREVLWVRGEKRRADLRRLERELYAYPEHPSEGAAKAIQLAVLRNPLEESMYAAALARRLVKDRGWRWDDILILCRDVEAYGEPLRTAFGVYGVPLFLSASRTAARHATAECLLTALKVIEKGYPPEDMTALMRTGLMPVTEDEADRFSNYIVRWTLRGTKFLRPLRWGDEAEREEMEDVRSRLTAPLVHLRDALRGAEVLEVQLTAIFDFLTEIGAYEKSQARMQALAEAGLWEAAGEEGQVWNRIMGALDQMRALMGEGRLSLRDLTEMLTESLSASVIKALPQSGDAVYAQSTDSACTRTAKAILVLGAADRPMSDQNGLLTSGQRQALKEFTQAYLGPDDEDLSRLRRFYLKSALGMASHYVSISCPMTGTDGSAQRTGAIFGMVRRLFPGTEIRGGVEGDASMEQMLRGAPEAAVSAAAKALSGECEGVVMALSDRAALAGLAKISEQMPHAGAELLKLESALNRARAADSLNPQTAKALYGALSRQSITHLEKFASCPFAYYAEYGLKPERVEPFGLNPMNEGTFFHAAMHEFMLRSAEDLNDLSADLAVQRMDAVAETLLDDMVQTGVMGDAAVTDAHRRRLKATAKMCAVILADHMRGSQFHPSGLEKSFGPEDGARALELPEGCVLEGRIDRVDEWKDKTGRYLRIIDYKRGGKKLNLAEAYYGLRLQLPIYLAAEEQRKGGQSAGVFYFPLNEGILNTQDTDAAQVEAQRRQELRMEGLIPDRVEVLEAMSPQFEKVLNVTRNKDGSLRKSASIVSEADFDNLSRCALRRAAEWLEGIRGGDCSPSPAHLDQLDACAYCRCKASCLYDARLDADGARKFQKLSPKDVLEILREEQQREDGQ